MIEEGSLLILWNGLGHDIIYNMGGRTELVVEILSALWSFENFITNILQNSLTLFDNLIVFLTNSYQLTYIHFVIKHQCVKTSFICVQDKIVLFIQIRWKKLCKNKNTD